MRIFWFLMSNLASAICLMAVMVTCMVVPMTFSLAITAYTGPIAIAAAVIAWRTWRRYRRFELRDAS
ncbi:hypothetical protein [Streptomyces sp. NPDC127098]|uniref:hypothetical protein n=1 Tax=Streptomyces sp. NPDC127098 TaxID=3347137 RepID=UPI00365AA43C